MRKTINLSPIIDEIGDIDAVHYILKLYLRDVEKLPIKIDPLNPGSSDLSSDYAKIDYHYNVSEDEFSITLDYDYVE